ncbi:MAG TPA: hypothetical protein VF792_13080 [Ktedonobacterales bacterium]
MTPPVVRAWPQRELLARGAQMIRALPTGALFVALGSLTLTVSNRLPVWLVAPAYALRSLLSGSDGRASGSAGATPFAGGIALLTLAALVAAFGFFIAGVSVTHSARTQRVMQWLAIPLLVWTLFASIQTAVILAQGAITSATQWPPRYTSDEMYYNQYGAGLVLAGVNPYTDANQHLRDAMVYFHIRGFTPIARGRFRDVRHVPTGKEMRAVAAEFQRHPPTPPPELDPRTLHSYPAGAFVVDIPSVLFGARGMGLAQIALFLALSVLLVALTPLQARLAVGMLIWENPAFAQRVVNGDFDIWWIAALIAAWMLYKRGWLSGALLGVACAIKQTAWFAAPFFLLWVWRMHGTKAAIRQAVAALAGFVLINLPWIIASPRAWAESLFLPLSLPLLPDGSGIVALGIAGLTPLANAHMYTALEVGIMLGALVLAWRLLAHAPYLGLVLPLLPLVAAWRSPERYFLALPVLALAALILTWRAERSAVVTPSAVEV